MIIRCIVIIIFLFIVSCSSKSILRLNSRVIESPICEIYEERIKEIGIINSNDTIEFVLLSDDFSKRKPVFLYFQGSTPVPIGVNYGKPEENSKKLLLAFSFLKDSTIDEIKKNYHLVVISMPATPLFPSVDQVTKDNVWYAKALEPEVEFYPAYYKANFLDNYVYRAQRVIDYLYAQDWVEKKHITLFGHSQGAKVAIKVAANNKKVFSVGFSGGNPYGRMDHIIRGYRYEALVGNIDHSYAQMNIENYYKAWDDMVRNPNSAEIKYADANKTYLSFEENLLPIFLKVKQPIYVCYGTADVKSVQSDILPIYFSSAKKTNLTMKPYPGLGHNYDKLDENLKPIGESSWDDVIKSFILWDGMLKQ